MSRNIIYRDNRFILVTGLDHMLGTFVQLFDNNMVNETPDGEGLVVDWSQGFKYEKNLTGIPNNEFEDAITLCNNYIKNELNDEEEFPLR